MLKLILSVYCHLFEQYANTILLFACFSPGRGSTISYCFCKLPVCSFSAAFLHVCWSYNFSQNSTFYIWISLMVTSLFSLKNVATKLFCFITLLQRLNFALIETDSFLFLTYVDCYLMLSILLNNFTKIFCSCCSFNFYSIIIVELLKFYYHWTYILFFLLIEWCQIDFFLW